MSLEKKNVCIECPINLLIFLSSHLSQSYIVNKWFPKPISTELLLKKKVDFSVLCSSYLRTKLETVCVGTHVGPATVLGYENGKSR